MNTDLRVLDLTLCAGEVQQLAHIRVYELIRFQLIESVAFAQNQYLIHLAFDAIIRVSLMALEAILHRKITFAETDLLNQFIIRKALLADILVT